MSFLNSAAGWLQPMGGTAMKPQVANITPSRPAIPPIFGAPGPKPQIGESPPSLGPSGVMPMTPPPPEAGMPPPNVPPPPAAPPTGPLMGGMTPAGPHMLPPAPRPAMRPMQQMMVSRLRGGPAGRANEYGRF